MRTLLALFSILSGFSLWLMPHLSLAEDCNPGLKRLRRDDIMIIGIGAGMEDGLAIELLLHRIHAAYPEVRVEMVRDVLLIEDLPRPHALELVAALPLESIEITRAAAYFDSIRPGQDTWRNQRRAHDRNAATAFKVRRFLR